MFRASRIGALVASWAWASPAPAPAPALAPATALAPGKCVVLQHASVTAQDVASLVPAFGTLQPPTRIAWAPAPGVTRWLSPGELVRLAHQHGLTLDPAPAGICFTRQVEALDRERVLAAMRAAEPSFEVELVSFGPKMTPPGRLEFSAQALPHPPRPAGATLPATKHPWVQWRGRLVSESGQVFPVWARARIFVRRPALVATRPIAAGQIVTPDAIAPGELLDYPGWDAPLSDPRSAIGRRVRRPIAAQAPLLPPLLAVRREVERGDSVAVELPGEATLIAEAESPGRIGETVLLRNPLTGRRFPSKVTGAGQAQMQAQMQAAPAPRAASTAASPPASRPSSPREPRTGPSKSPSPQETTPQETTPQETNAHARP